MKSKLSQTIIRTLATKYKLTPKQVENIVKSPFEFQSDVMINKCSKELMIFPTTRIRGFGVFTMPEAKRIKIYKAMQDGTSIFKQKDVGSGDQSRGNSD